jgi:outer membrane protein
MRNLMNPMFGLLLASTAALCSTSVLAEVKIGTLRGNDLVQQSPQYKSASERMKAEFEKRAGDLEAELKKLQEDAKKFQKEADLLSPADRARQQKDLDTRKIDFDYKSRQFEEDRTNRQRQLLSDMMASIRAVIEDVARQKALDLVINDPVFAAPSIDITGDVLKRLQAGPAGK